MKIFSMEEMHRGWFVGDFSPCAFRTADFEVGVLSHKAGENWPAHYHKEVVEINYLVAGDMTIQGKMLHAGDIFVIDRGEVADPVFHSDCIIVVVKTPSRPADKVEVSI